MAEIIFTYEGSNTSIQCDINHRIEDITKKFLIKINREENINLYYLYNSSQINKELTFMEQENQIDKNIKKWM